MSDKIARLKWSGLFMAALVLVAGAQWSTGVYDRSPGLLLIVATFVVVAIVAILAFCTMIWFAVRAHARMMEDGKNRHVIRPGPATGLLVSFAVFVYATRFMVGMDGFGINAGSVPFLSADSSLLESGARLGALYVGLLIFFGAAPFLEIAYHRGTSTASQVKHQVAAKLAGLAGRGPRARRGATLVDT